MVQRHHVAQSVPPGFPEHCSTIRGSPASARSLPSCALPLHPSASPWSTPSSSGGQVARSVPNPRRRRGLLGHSGSLHTQLVVSMPGQDRRRVGVTKALQVHPKLLALRSLGHHPPCSYNRRLLRHADDPLSRTWSSSTPTRVHIHIPRRPPSWPRYVPRTTWSGKPSHFCGPHLGRAGYPSARAHQLALRGCSANVGVRPPELGFRADLPWCGPGHVVRSDDRGDLGEVAGHGVALPRSTRAGSSVAQMSCAFQQRVRKRQPDGGDCGLGTSPSKTMCLRARSARGSGMGTAESSAWV